MGHCFQRTDEGKGVPGKFITSATLIAHQCLTRFLSLNSVSQTFSSKAKVTRCSLKMSIAPEDSLE